MTRFEQVTKEQLIRTAQSLFRGNDIEKATLCLIVLLEEQNQQVNALTVYERCIELDIEVTFEQIYSAFIRLIKDGMIYQYDQT